MGGLSIFVAIGSVSLPALAAASLRFGLDRRVNDDLPGTQARDTESSGQHNLIAVGDSAYLVWGDARGGAYFASSANRGMTFGTNLPVSDVNTAWYPALAASGSGHIVVAWEDTRDHPINSRIYFDHSLDGGRTFGVDHAISTTFPAGTKQRQPAIALDPAGGTIYIAWFDDRYPPLGAIVCARSVDGGASFEAPVQLTTYYANPPRKPTLAIGPHGEVYAAWYEHGLGTDDTRCSVSLDQGRTFNSSVHAIWGFYPSLAAASSGDVYVASVWNVGIAWWVVVARSSDAGAHFGPAVIVDTGSTTVPSIGVGRTGQVFVAWSREWAPKEIRIASSTDRGDTFTQVERVNDVTTSYVMYPCVAVTPGGRPLVAWTDSRAEIPFTEDIYIDGRPLGDTGPRGTLARAIPGTPATPITVEGPNPFRDAVTLTIRAKTGDSTIAHLRIVDATGRLVRDYPIPSASGASTAHVVWTGTDQKGRPVVPGMYFATLYRRGEEWTERIIRLK